MSAILRRTARDASPDSAKPDKAGIGIFASGLGGEFAAVFAVCVLLGALWLLVSGYA